MSVVAPGLWDVILVEQMVASLHNIIMSLEDMLLHGHLAERKLTTPCPQLSSRRDHSKGTVHGKL